MNGFALLVCSLLAYISAASASPAYTRSIYARVANPRYSHIVAFGDSYSTNSFNGTLGGGYAPNRLSNGNVTVEDLSNLQDIPIFDYAIGGATVTGQNISVDTQVAKYLSDLKAGKYATINAKGRALYFFWVGINDITQVFTDHNPGDSPSDSNYPYNSTAYNLATSVFNVAGQIENARMNEGSGLYDFFFIQIPQLELTPRGVAYCGGNATYAGTPNKVRVYKGMTDVYNQQIIDGSQYFNNVLRSRGRYGIGFPLAGFWRDFHANPSKWGFANVSGWAWGNSSADASVYLYWDPIHVTKVAHLQIAKLINPFISRDPSQ